MKPSEFQQWQAVLGIGTPLLAAIFVFIVCITHIDGLLNLLSKIQELGISFSSKARKSTISNGIRGRVIKASKKLKDVDPEVIIKDLKIEWVKEENIESFVNKGQVIVRMKQETNPHKNFVTAVSTYVNRGLLPRAQRYIDKDVLKASNLSVTRSLIINGDDDALEYFDNSVLSPIINADEQIAELINDIRTLDGNGMFYQILLNEYSKAARKIYPDISDPCLTAESKEFLYFLQRIAMGCFDELRFNREYFKVNIFITAKTETYLAKGMKPYLSSIFSSIDNGIETIYIFGLGRKMKIAEDIAVEAQNRDFRISKIKAHCYKHRSLNDGKRVDGVCYEVCVYKDK